MGKSNLPTLPEMDDDSQPGLRLDARLVLALESAADNLEGFIKAWRKEQARLAQLPSVITLEQIVVPGVAQTSALVEMGGGSAGFGPQPGRTWIVRLLAALASPPAANASIITWYVGQNISNVTAPGVLPVTMARWQFPSVPGFQTFTSNVIQLLPNQHLIAGLTNIPGSSPPIALMAVVNEQPLYAQTSAIAVE